jgi:hypothetical protein
MVISRVYCFINSYLFFSTPLLTKPNLLFVSTKINIINMLMGALTRNSVSIGGRSLNQRKRFAVGVLLLFSWCMLVVVPSASADLIGTIEHDYGIGKVDPGGNDKL